MQPRPSPVVCRRWRVLPLRGRGRPAVAVARRPRAPPAHRLRVPRTGLDRNEVGSLLVAAGLASARDHALISLLAINGLRVSEALGANIEALGIERGHRTLTVVRKGGKIVIIPLAPRTARAIDLAIGERAEGPIFLPRTATGSTATPHGGSCAALLARPGSTSRSARTRCATRSSRPHSTQASRCAPSKKPPATPTREPPCAMTAPASHADPRTTMRYDRARVSVDRHATYVVAAFLAGAAR